MAKRHSNLSAISVGLAISVLGLAVLSAETVALLAGLEIAPTVAVAMTALGLVLGLTGLWSVRERVNRYLLNLERLRSAILVNASRQTERSDALSQVIQADAEVPDADLADLCDAIETLTDSFASQGKVARTSTSDPRMSTVLAAVDQPICAITDDGLISMANTAAQELLGQDEMRVGTTIFDVFLRHDLMNVVAEAHERGEAVDTELSALDDSVYRLRVLPLPTELSGAVLRFTAEPGAHPIAHRQLHVDLSLHDAPPVAQAHPETPLSELPALIYDSETTGLDLQEARLLSMGAVRVHGTTIYRGATLDLLVNPEVKITARNTAIHGITNEMVADAPQFSAVSGQYEALSTGAVIIGHSIGFDLAILRNELLRAGKDWQTPLALDTLQLLSALYPNEEKLGLDAICERFGVEIHGRHTALGDALVTAELWVRMIPLLLDAGVTTLAEARSFAGQATSVISRQAEAGWVETHGPLQAAE
ncbi:MAG: exonuclease domain-containing protein [Alphaproteobacteria bacterium]|nr:exonuclease domain-containing protein [Alphaproteobacteria bacterium]